jgi:16S rRNA (guanine(966)-N(2))-methyltransferase RsmD
MRVIGGEFRSRRLLSMPGADVRPTPDRLRETLFNVLAPRIEGAVFLDAYAGTGSVGIEALSRGAKQAVFLEKNSHAVELIRKNLKTLEIEGRARVIPGSAALYLGSVDADIVFIDPPYPKENEYQLALDVLEKGKAGLVIAQHSVHFAMQGKYGSLCRTREIQQGENVLSFFGRT